MPSCVDCGAEFGTPQSRAKRCPTCRKAYRYGLRLAWARRNRERMNAHQRASYWRHHERNLERTRSWRAKNPGYFRTYKKDYAARKKMVRAALTNPEAWAVVNAPQLRTCPRLHVTALHLPCGQREECHLNPACEHAGGERQRNANWGWRGGEGGSLERVPRKGAA